MKRVLSLTLFAAKIAALAALVGCPSPPGPSHTGHGHSHDHGHNNVQEGGHASLLVGSEPTEVQAGKPAVLKLMILGDGGVVKDFEVVHEKKVHLIVVRDGLDTFAHLHPQVDDSGNLTTEFTFPTGGTYRLYADYQPAGGEAATVMAEVKVGGESPPSPPLTPDVPGKVKGDGLDAAVSVNGAKVGGEAAIRFEVADPAGKPVTDLRPYMGAMGHLVVISQDGKEYVHAHPADEKATGNVVAFEAHFPRPGLYKGWGQFRRQGGVHVVPFVLRVE